MKNLVFLFLSLVVINQVHSQTYNPLKDYEHNQNPSGVWSFGYGTVGGDFIPSPKMDTKETASIYATNEDWKGVYLNPASGKDIALSEGLVLKSGMVMMHPGNKGDHLSKIRFTAPEDGEYTVNAKYTNIDQQAKNTWNWVYTNAISETGKKYDFTPSGFKELFTKGTKGYNQSNTFSKAIKMKKGEIISFEMGNGGDGYTDDAQSVELSVEKLTPITLYKGANFTGQSLEINGDWSAASDMSWNDVISSIKIPAGWEVTIYEHAPGNPSGKSLILTNDWNAPADWKGKISNIRVSKK